MNLDGTDREYRVLKNVGNGVHEVMTMWNVSDSTAFDSNNTNTYAGNTLDTYLNTTWYNTLSTTAKNAIVPKTITQDSWTLNATWDNALSTTAKNAIVPKTITQDSWSLGTFGSPQYSGTHGTTAPGSASYTISKGSNNYAAIGSRYVYAMSVQEVIDYLSDESVLVDTSGMLRNQNIWKMFWNQTSAVTEYPWLRSAIAGNSTYALLVYGYTGFMFGFNVSYGHAVRGALQIDLSKISYTINETS